MFSEAENFCRNLQFSIVNRNRRQWTVEHLHATAGDLLRLSFETFHKCSDNNIIQGLETSRFEGHASKPCNTVGKHLLFTSSTITASNYSN